MKTPTLTVLIFLALQSIAFGEVFTRSEITGTTKNVWIQDGTTASPAPDVKKVDFGNVSTIFGETIFNGDLTISSGNYLYADPQTAFLAYEEATGFFEEYSTAGIFYKWQNNIDESGSFGNLSTSKATGEITVLAGGAGLYKIVRDTGIHGQPDINYSFAIFVNETAVSQSHTSPGTPPESFPVATALSATLGTATYDNNSSLSFLFYPDNDQIKIVESSSGNGVEEWCFEYDIDFNINHVPHFVKLGNNQYIGGANHFLEVLAFNNDSLEWDDLRDATEDIKNVGTQADFKNATLAFAFPNDGGQVRYILNLLVRVKIRHNDGVVCSNGHEFWIDEAKIEDLLGARSDSGLATVELEVGDVVTIREKPSQGNKFFHRHRTRLDLLRVGN